MDLTRKRTLSCLAVVMLLVVGCGGPASSGKTPSTTTPSGKSPTTQVSEVVIGAVLPLSGGSAASGAQMRDGYQMAVDEINAQGGIKSLGGAKFKLVVRDSEGKADVGGRAAEALVSDAKASVLIGSYNSAVCVVVAQSAERLKVPYVITDCTADELTESGYKYLFRLDTKAKLITMEAVKAVQWAGNKAGTPIKKISLLDEDSAWGQSMKTAFEQAAKAQGLEVGESLLFKTGTTDLSPQAARIKASGAEWLIGGWYATDMVTLLKSYPGIGLNATRASTYGGGLQNPGSLKLGNVAEGATGFSMWNPDINLPGVKEWVQKYKARFNDDPVMNAAKAYRGVWVVKDVLERAAALDTSKIRDAFTQTNISAGPAMIVQKAPIAFDATGQMKEASLIMFQVQNGEFKTVWPEDVASVPLDLKQIKQNLIMK